VGIRVGKRRVVDMKPVELPERRRCKEESEEKSGLKVRIAQHDDK